MRQLVKPRLPSSHNRQVDPAWHRALVLDKDFDELWGPELPRPTRPRRPITG